MGEFVLDLPEDEIKEAGGADALPRLLFSSDGTWKMSAKGEPPTQGKFKLSGSKLTLTTDGEAETIDFEVERGGEAVLEISEEPRENWTRFAKKGKAGS